MKRHLTEQSRLGSQIEKYRKLSIRQKADIAKKQDRIQDLEDELEHATRRGRQAAHREFAGLMNEEIILHGKELRELHRRLSEAMVSRAVARIRAREEVKAGRMKPKVFKGMFGVRHTDDEAAECDADALFCPRK